jgi:hypothetical protein
VIFNGVLRYTGETKAARLISFTHFLTGPLVTGAVAYNWIRRPPRIPRAGFLCGTTTVKLSVLLEPEDASAK